MVTPFRKKIEIIFSNKRQIQPDLPNDVMIMNDDDVMLVSFPFGCRPYCVIYRYYITLEKGTSEKKPLLSALGRHRAEPSGRCSK